MSKGSSMIRVLMIANNSLLADGVAALLAQEINLDVVRLTQQDLGQGEPRSVLIVIDDGQPEDELMNMIDLFRARPNFIVIMLSLRSRNIIVYESFQLINPEMQQLVHIIREFSKMNLKKNPDEHSRVKTSLFSAKHIAAFFTSCLLYLLGRKNMSNVTPSFENFSEVGP